MNLSLVIDLSCEAYEGRLSLGLAQLDFERKVKNHTEIRRPHMETLYACLMTLLLNDYSIFSYCPLDFPFIKTS